MPAVKPKAPAASISGDSTAAKACVQPAIRSITSPRRLVVAESFDSDDDAENKQQNGKHVGHGARPEMPCSPDRKFTRAVKRQYPDRGEQNARAGRAPCAAMRNWPTTFGHLPHLAVGIRHSHSPCRWFSPCRDHHSAVSTRSTGAGLCTLSQQRTAISPANIIPRLRRGHTRMGLAASLISLVAPRSRCGCRIRRGGEQAHKLRLPTDACLGKNRFEMHAHGIRCNAPRARDLGDGLALDQLSGDACLGRS